MLHQSADLYGSDRMFLEVARWVRDAGGAPLVLLPADGPLLALLREERIETHGLAEARLLKLRRAQGTAAGLAALARNAPGALRAIDACVAGRRIDAVYSSTLATLGGAMWARARHRPHLWHLHEVLERPRAAGWALARLVAASSDHVICNSAATRDWFIAQCPAAAARSSVVWNGIAAPVGVRPVQCPAGNADGDGSVAIGLVGRINPHKGHELLLQALETLHHAGNRRGRLVFAGDAAAGAEDQAQALAARVAASPVASRVSMLGFVDRTAPLYAALDIVCMPSTVTEGFGLVAVEAMAAARPVVAADAGGLREVVESGVTGWLHRRGDVGDLAARLARLIDDPAQRLAMGQRGLERFGQRFTLVRMRERLALSFAHLGDGLAA
jgi:glycosyltransferase involved in cell wall biosynthesis